MNTSDTQARPKIFIACPIGSEDSPERARSDKLLKFVIHPVVEELLGGKAEEVVVRADKRGEPGRLTMQVLRELSECDVVIADVTGTNANVMYEVGIRQALMRPFVLMCQKGQNLPFDLNDLRTVFYKLDLDHFEQAQSELKQHLQKALSGSISPVDQALFSAAKSSEQPQPDSQSGESLLAVMQVCENILHETREMKDLVLAVSNITVGLQETKEAQEKAQQERLQQEMGMWMMQQLIQNPDGAEKVLPAMQALADFGKMQEQPAIQPVQNRSTRRKQQKG